MKLSLLSVSGTIAVIAAVSTLMFTAGVADSPAAAADGAQDGSAGQPTSPSKESRAAVLRQAEGRIKAIYERHLYWPRKWSATWSADGTSFIRVETRARGQQELASYDAATGRRTVILSGSQLASDKTPRTGRILGYEFSNSGNAVFLTTESEDGKGVIYQVFDTVKGESIGRIVEQVAPRRVGLERKLSPDGKHVLFATQGELRAFNVQEGRSATLVELPEDVHLWFTQWSPDGKQIAFVYGDERRVKQRAMLWPTDPTYPKVIYRRFPLPGERIPELRVGVVDVSGSPIRWMAVQEEEGFHVGGIGWTNDSKQLHVEKLSRTRDAREFFLADAQTGKVRSLYRETDPAWVDAGGRPNAGLDWINGGKEFVILSEQGGWRQAFAFSTQGEKLRCLTPEASDIIWRGPVHEGPVHEDSGWFYYLASPDNATQRYLYRAPLNGAKKPERVTPDDQTGSHDYDISPNGRWAFHTWSTFDTPPVTELVDLPEHNSLRVLEKNRRLRHRVAPLIPRPTEFFQLEVDDGVTMDAWMIKPRDFDPGKKYPVLVFVYGEVAAQTVLDDWNGGQYFTMFHRAIADLGYLVVSMDNRGTPAPKGAAWRRAVFGSLGPLSTKEQASALRELGRTRDYVDMSRIGIWGWSGGGTSTLNALFREPDLYHVGIAVAPRPQPRLYHAAYQEPYMRTPETNPEGYRKSAAINFAQGLQGDLLIVHGSGETNTHIQMVEGLIDRLISMGKQFDYMVYPNRDHALRKGKGTTVHLYMLITRYLIDHLPRGPRPIK